MVQLKIKYSLLSKQLVQNKDIKQFIKETFNLSDDRYTICAKQKIDRFIKTHDLKLKKECRFKQNEFLARNKEWLEREMCFDNEVNEQMIEEPSGDGAADDNSAEEFNVGMKRLRSSAMDNNGKRPRVNKPAIKNIVRIRAVKPVKQFDQCSRRTKKRRCDKIRSEISEAQLNAMFISYLKRNNRKSDAKILQKLRSASPERKTKILKILDEDTDIVPYTANEALALIVDANLSYHQYEIIHHQATSRNANIYPPYNRILDAKKECYPIEESISISDTRVNINLQNILDHTSER